MLASMRLVSRVLRQQVCGSSKAGMFWHLGVFSLRWHLPSLHYIMSYRQKTSCISTISVIHTDVVPIPHASTPSWPDLLPPPPPPWPSGHCHQPCMQSTTSAVWCCIALVEQLKQHYNTATGRHEGGAEGQQPHPACHSTASSVSPANG